MGKKIWKKKDRQNFRVTTKDGIAALKKSLRGEINKKVKGTWYRTLDRLYLSVRWHFEKGRRSTHIYIYDWL